MATALGECAKNAGIYRFLPLLEYQYQSRLQSPRWCCVCSVCAAHGAHGVGVVCVMVLRGYWCCVLRCDERGLCVSAAMRGQCRHRGR